ncbi:cell wall integrity/stress response component [Citrus sinensis]|uniref:Cell wall integrity/stress response component n=1 Tax=Citrus sinensis TaxID=2711 RepID=A0ACB8IZB6_CITSI|nr:cell wall integrity/stress response component [Citrus sinensis]
MAFAHYLTAVHPVPVVTSEQTKISILPLFTSSSSSSSSSSVSTQSLFSKARKLSLFPRFRRIGHKAKVKSPESEINSVAEAFTNFKHLLLPITDQNPYLSEGTRQAAATTAALAKKYGADITVVVIDERQKESLPEHENRLSSIRWHLSEGGFQEFRLLERLGEGSSKPTAIIGDVADELNLDLVIISMEAIHSKHVDANLLAEFIPCPVLLLPL